jgi:phytoene dehydrogenase-like protein
MADAVVIGSGPNGLVAANLLADHGWDVVVVEAASEPGGGVRSGELMEPGFVNDHCSAFYPLAAASPVLRAMELEQHGLTWLRPPLALAHPAGDGSCPVIAPDRTTTSASLDELAPGDGRSWDELYGRWEQIGDHVLAALLTPFPPVRALAGMARAVPASQLLEEARLGAVTVRRLGEEQFEGEGGRRLLAGLALHADLTPESALGGFFGWLLACLGQEVGFPVPAGGASRLTEAMVARLRSRGGEVVCDARAEAVVVRDGRAVAVRVAGLGDIDARRAVVADTDAVQLYGRLVPREALPAGFLDQLSRFEWDEATFKVDWNLDAPIPWAAEPARRAGAVHIAESVDELTMASAELSCGRIPDRPPLVMGQQSMTDPSRQPVGCETAWAYTKVPRHVAPWGSSAAERLADRLEERVEEIAPGFRGLVRRRHVTTPDDFERTNPNMSLGALNLGSSKLHQQVIFRPVPGMGRAETPVRSLYLGSASAHPGGGVHGACGANAARAALFRDRVPAIGRTLASVRRSLGRHRA